MEEVSQVETKPEDENLDSVLSSVSDEYLAKKKKRKNFILSAISLFVLALVVVIIVLSSVKVNTCPRFLTKPSSYTITIENEDYGSYAEGEDYEEFNKLFFDVFKIPYLSAMFTGKLGGYTIEEPEGVQRFYSSNTSATLSSNVRNKLNSSYIKLSFGEDITMLNKDGSVYYSKYSRLGENVALTFDEVYFNIYSTNQEHEVTMLFATNGFAYTTLTEVKVTVNTYPLYDYLTK